MAVVQRGNGGRVVDYLWGTGVKAGSTAAVTGRCAWANGACAERAVTLSLEVRG